MWTPRGNSGALRFLKNQVVKFRSSNLFGCGSEKESEDLWICDGKIIDAKARFWLAREHKEFAADVEVDCSGLCICPGFIDWQLSKVTYTGNASVRNVEIAEGVTARMDILGANTSNDSGPRGLLLDKRAGIDVFGHLIALRDALHAGDQTAITTAAEGLAKDETGYIQSFAEIGADQGRLESAGRQNDSMAVSLNQMISQESDVDLAQTLVELNQLQAAYSAALQSAGKILRLSLLDYI